MRLSVAVIAVGLLLLGCCVACIAADPVVTQAVYWPRAGGGYSLEFTFLNHTPTDTLYITRVGEADPLEIQAPPGWYAVDGLRDISWRTTYPEYAISPGQAKTGFVFAVAAVSSQYYWWASGTDTYQGYTSPTLIPEPSSLLALAGGLAGLGAGALRRRRG